jgi:probable O-glycosylation ligase (exosortase A-associated)
MLRDLVLTAAFLTCIWLTFRNPFAGILAWTWLAIMQPHRESYGFFSSTLRFNLTIAVITILAWSFSKERKLPAVDATLVTVLLFFLWMTFNCIFAVDPGSSWPLWDSTWRILALGVLVGAVTSNKIRIHALMWIIALSLGYYGTKGGLLTLMTGGAKTITGPVDTLIGDNNQLALALLMILPLLYYLRRHSANRLVRIGLTVIGLLTCLSVIGSYSRGAYLALGALCILGWLRARNKFTYPLLVALVLVPILKFMPQAFYDRANTLLAADQDHDMLARIQAWKVSYYYARDHFPLGAGFAGAGTPQVYHTYFPGEASRAAHSIYFQVLGDHGFVGLALFLTIMVLALVNTYRIRKATKRRPEFAWAYDLATAIQLGILVYCVGGAALSMAYDDVFVIWAMLLPVLRGMVTATERGRTRMPKAGLSAMPEQVTQ